MCYDIYRFKSKHFRQYNNNIYSNIWGANIAYHIMTIIKFFYVLTEHFKCNKCNFYHLRERLKLG